MPTLNHHSSTRNDSSSNVLARARGAVLLLLFVLPLLAIVACKKNADLESMESDANGYLCLKCGAKYCTPRTVFIGPKCPKCQEDALMPVVGYYCEKDKHLTIRAQRGDPHGAVCEICQTPLVNAMRTPREAELKTWGAINPP
jgi:hypothetical protein